jgi:hypothetical protein
MPGVTAPPNYEQLRSALLALAAGIERVAGTLRSSGEVTDTATAMLDLRAPLTEAALRLERIAEDARR